MCFSGGHKSLSFSFLRAIISLERIFIILGYFSVNIAVNTSKSILLLFDFNAKFAASSNVFKIDFFT